MSHRSVKSEDVTKKKINFTQKDYERISDWYQSCKQNYFSQTTLKQPLKKDQLRQVHLKIYFSQIYLTEISINTHFVLLKNLSPKPLCLTGGILKSQDKQFQGKPYEYKNIQSVYNSSTRSVILSQQMNLFTYCLETKKRDSTFLLEFALANSEGQLFRLGKLQINVNASLNEISELSIFNKKGQKVAYIHSIVEKDPIENIWRFIPPNVIIDQNSKIPSIKAIEMKNKRQPFSLDTKAKIIVDNLRIEIPNKSKFMQKIHKNNPFTNNHYENVQVVSTNFKIQFGSHNSYKFIEYQQEMMSIQMVQDNERTLNLNSMNSKEQNNDVLYLKRKQAIRKMRKTYFDCQKTVFIAILIAQVEFKLNGMSQDVTQIIGWCVLLNKLYENHIKIESILENANPIVGYPIQIQHQGIKLNAQIQNPDYKYYKKRLQDELVFEANQNNLFIDPNNQDQLLTKTFFVRRQATQILEKDNSSDSKDQDENDKEIKSIIEEMERHLQTKNKKMTIKGYLLNPEYINDTERSLNTQTNWQHLLSLEKKVLVKQTQMIKFGIKLSSLIPNTDEITLTSGRYYLPERFKVKIHLMRKSLQLQGCFEQNIATFNIPSFIRSKKQMTFMETLIHNRKQISKILQSSMIVNVTDLQTNKFYAKGVYKTKHILNNETTFKLSVNLQNQGHKMGQLVFEMSISTRNRQTSYKRQIEMIEKDKILHSLPMKERMMMRISNFNKSSKQMENKAIEIYKSKTHTAVINQITNQEINNYADIHFQLGEPSYFLVNFKNQSSSENNQFTLSINNCDFAEIVTDQNQYKQACLDAGLDIIPFHKITLHVENFGQQGLEKCYYNTKIVENMTVGILLKINLQDWNPHIKEISNFTLEILRNTMPVISHKFRLLFREPLIGETVSMEQINPKNSKQLNLYLPQNITQKYTSFVSFSKSLRVKNNKSDIKVQIKDRIKSPYKLQLMIQGKAIGLNSQDKFVNILIEVLLLDGEFMEVQLGHIYNKHFIIDTKANPSLHNQVIVLHEKQPSNCLTIDRAVYLLSKEEKVEMKVCSFESGVENVVLNFYGLNNEVKYQYLLKIITKMKTPPVVIEVQNFVGERVILSCPNPYVDKCQFVIATNNNMVYIDRQIIPVSPKSTQNIVLEILNKLQSKTYIGVYDDYLMLIRLYQINFFDKNTINTYQLVKQHSLYP